jgi:hypothetical protein
MRYTFRYVKIGHGIELYQKMFRKRNISLFVLLTLTYSVVIPLLCVCGFGGKKIAINKLNLQPCTFSKCCIGNIYHNEEAGICTLKFNTVWIIYIGTFSITVMVIVICYAHIYITVVRFELVF